MERLAWDVTFWIDGWFRNDNGHESNPDHPDAATPLSSSSEEEASSSCRDKSGDGQYEICDSEICRYCCAAEKALFWEDRSYLVNFHVIVLLNLINTALWIYDALRLPTVWMPFGILTVYFIVHMTLVLNFVNTLAPAKEHQKLCSSLHWAWKFLQRLRSEQPGLHCILVCTVAFALWFLGRINLSTPYSLYWTVVLGPLILRLPLKVSEKISRYFISHKEWQCDSEIEDEFLPMVTEANLQVLSQVGETGDHSPTPTSASSEAQNDSFNDEEYIEGLYDIAPSMPSHEDGSTDGVELSELELSVGENDNEEDDIKFQAGHFDKSSTSSSEEDVFNVKKINADSSDDSSSDYDFEIIHKEDVEKLMM